MSSRFPIDPVVELENCNWGGGVNAEGVLSERQKEVGYGDGCPLPIGEGPGERAVPLPRIFFLHFSHEMLHFGGYL